MRLERQYKENSAAALRERRYEILVLLFDARAGIQRLSAEILRIPRRVILPTDYPIEGWPNPMPSVVALKAYALSLQDVPELQVLAKKFYEATSQMEAAIEGATLEEMQGPSDAWKESFGLIEGWFVRDANSSLDSALRH
ncbi:hypothetical protein G3O06_20545 [Burkholderia sp. Ac-20345]|uniref:hypothetical protein n=1 Tax=Burkholderia sp. Ac-20345 TaxID=2703891 RepID=UPI00197C9AFA|nr:hypothetical protein [Burkholderia sp. Ac-20345]MBN3779929.1 hypothetical protein [Burkholderia sp. Ac-20345]